MRSLQQIAAAQDGVVHRTQAVAVGLSRLDIDGLCPSGLWRRLSPSTYLAAADQCDEVPRRARIRAAVQSLGRSAVAVLHTAAELHGIAGLPRTEEIDVSVPAEKAAVTGIAHWERPFTSSPCRAPTLSGSAASPPRMPYDELQYVVRDSDGCILGVADLTWRRQRVIAEADGAGPHSTPQALYEDRKRQNRVANAGWQVLRFAWADTLRPDYIPFVVREAQRGLGVGWVGSRVVRVLLIGSGGREHALALGLAADPAVDQLIAAPGNPGVAQVAELRDVKATDPDAVAALAVETGVDLVVVGPEAPLVAGVADAVRAKGIACFGPSAAAARLEGSKAFAKDVMNAAGVPTAQAFTCTTPEETARALDAFGPPYVVKNDGLAAGKGVVVTDDRAAALAHAAECGRVVVEEYLAGPEVSLFVVTDGEAAVPLLPAQDFKRVRDGDQGPNTGGMGAYAPLPWAPDGLVEQVMAETVTPTLAEMRHRGTPFAGLLYVGLAITADGPKVIEFNARFGDPETQVVLALLATPLGGLLHAAATGTLAGHPPLRWHDGAAVTVVLAAQNYPGPPRAGDVITGGEVPGVIHAGTARRAEDGALISAGGRVLCATATGADLAAARQAAYDLLAGVRLDGAHHRTDIALGAVRGEITVPR